MKLDSANKGRKKAKKANKKNPVKEKRGKPGTGALARQARKTKKMESKECERTLAFAAAEQAKAEKKKRKKKRSKTAYLECRELGPDSDVEEWRTDNNTTDADAKLKLGETLQTIDFSKAEPFKRNFLADIPAMEEEAIKKTRQHLGIKLKAKDGPLSVAPPVQSFNVHLHGLIKQFTDAMPKLSKPTAVQMQCIPAALQGFNILGIAPTGSGKTLAFLLPAIPHVAAQKAPLPGEGPIAMIVEPTRELAMQVCECARPFRKLFKMNTQVVYGGQEKAVQVDALHWAGVHFLVATPGRLIDLLEINALKLGRVTYFVIDEADRMLSMGFEEQLNSVASQVRPDRQTFLFSATFPGKLREASAKWLENPVTIRVNVLEMEGQEEAAVPKTESEVPKSDVQGSSKTNSLAISETIEQKVVVCASHKKPRKLMKYITQIRQDEKEKKVRNASLILIFCTKIKTLKFVVDFLRRHEIYAEALHGQLPQMTREATLRRFKAGKLNLLIATDVAARGLHINNLKHVVNYDFPASIEQYCHRIGRTGRNGKPGFSYSFFTRNFAPLAKDLVSILERYNQPVDQYLRELVDSKAPMEELGPEEMEGSDLDFDNLSDDGLDEIMGMSSDEEEDRASASGSIKDDMNSDAESENDEPEDAESEEAEEAEDDGPAEAECKSESECDQSEDEDMEVEDTKSYGGIRVQTKVKLDDSDDEMETEVIPKLAAPAGFLAMPPVTKEEGERRGLTKKERNRIENRRPRNASPPKIKKEEIKNEESKKKSKKPKLVRPRGKRGGKKKGKK